MPYGFNEDKSKYDLAALLADLAGNEEAIEALRNLLNGYEMSNGKMIGLKSTNITSGTAPSSGTLDGNGMMFLRDAANNIVGTVKPQIQSNGTQWLAVYAQRAVGGSNKYVGLSMGVKSDGTANYYVHDADAFRAAIGMDAVHSDISLSNATANLFRLSKQGNVVIMHVHGLKINSALANGSNVTLGTGVVPSAYRPISKAVTAGIYSTVQASSHGILVDISTAGNIVLYNSSGNQLAATTQLYGTACWMV